MRISIFSISSLSFSASMVLSILDTQSRAVPKPGTQRVYPESSHLVTKIDSWIGCKRE